MTIQDTARHKIIVLDGALGTKIQSYGLTEADFRGVLFKDLPGQLKGNNDMLCLTRPDIVAEIHKKYLEAGADVIETNTFSSQTISQADYGLQHAAREMALQGARIARHVADEWSTAEWPRFVAGSMGPTNRMLSMSDDVDHPATRSISYDQLLEAYTEQAAALIEGGVDLLLIETCFDTLNAKCAVDAARRAMDNTGREVPVMVSVTFSDNSGRTLSGQNLDAFMTSMEPLGLWAIGMNCGMGARQLMPYVKQMAAKSPVLVGAYPNAGLPNAMGEYDETPESMAAEMKEFLDEGLLNIIGGCCGTDEHFIQLFARMAKDREPRQPAARDGRLRLSGLDMLEKTDEIRFVNVGERCNVAGSRKFLRLINEKKYDEALGIARKQVADGALVIDVNMDDAMLDARKEMTTFLNLIATEPEIAKVPVMIDSSNWEVIRAGLKCCQGKSIVNSISLKEGEDTFIRHAKEARRMGAAVVVMLFDEQGQAVSYERKIEIAQRSYNLLTQKAGMPDCDIIFDPNILSIATGMAEHDSYAADYIRAAEWIRKHYPLCHISGGVSNLSFSFRGNNYIREAMHAVFLYHAIQHGMDFGIVNPATKVTYNDIPADQIGIFEDAILYRRKGAADDLISLATKLKEQQAGKDNSLKGNQSDEWRNGNLEDRLKYALRKGVGDWLTKDLTEALRQYPHAIDIIEGPLMNGMNEVGDLFGQGKMFLPQVVKTARTMRQAVDFLQPYIEAEKAEEKTSSGKIVLATVKGDVHDIGKNIVGVVLACNNFDITDLGIMVPAEKIVETAKREHADMIGLSGLITPSLTEMANVARLMKESGLNIPILVGGAATTLPHTALKIQPVYDGPVVWIKDAAQIVGVANALLSEATREAFTHKLAGDYEQIRHKYEAKQQKLQGIEEARHNKLNLFNN